MATAFQDSPLAFQDSPLASQIDAGAPPPTPAPAVISNNFGGGGIPLAHELFYNAWEKYQKRKLENEDDWIIGWAVSDDDP